MTDHEFDENEARTGSRRRWISCDIEEAYLGEDRKAGRVDRKRAVARDRSKYKKTDQDKLLKRKEAGETKVLQEDLKRGRVLSITSRGIVVEDGQHRWHCMLRGAMKKEKTHAKNLVIVGDFVLFKEQREGEGTIAMVEPRRTILSRADNLSRRKEQLLAANIDQVLITVSVVIPPLKPSLVDRYLIAAKKGGMEPVIVVNKIDLLETEGVEEEEKALFEAFVEGYRQAGLTVVPVSTVAGYGLEHLREVMKGKASVFSGPSGVGKSSLINAVTGMDLSVGVPVMHSKKGAHTTSNAQLIPLSFGGWCIDTPGIKSFGVWDLEIEELEGYFTEIHEFGKACKFPDCTHTHEEDCAVKNAVEAGEISLLRYESYLSLIASMSEEHKRR